MSTTKVNLQTRSVSLRAAIAMILLLFFFGNVMAVEPHSPGTSLYIVAPSGLQLRTSPDLQANKIKTLYHGEEVTVLEQPDSLQSLRLRWVTGNWIRVEHMGDEGYIFDGYATPLTLPQNEWEMASLDMDLIYPLEQWAEVNHMVFKTDTTEGTYITKVTDHYLNGNTFSRINSGDIYKVELQLSDVRIMDAYHLLQSMLDDKRLVDLFQEQTVFIEEELTPDLKRIKVKLDNPVDIRKMENGNIKVTIYSKEYPCQL